MSAWIVRLLGYPAGGAVIRFVKIVLAAAIVAAGSVLTHVLSIDQAWTAFTFTIGTALLVAGEKLQRETSNARRTPRPLPRP